METRLLQEEKYSVQNGAIKRMSSLLFSAKGENLISPIPLTIGLILLAVFTLSPFIYLITSSISSTPELVNGHLFPHNPILSNYTRLFTGSGGADFIKSIYNSVEVAVLTTFFSMIIGIFPAFVFARVNFPFRKTSLLAILSMQMIPSISIIVPLYVMMKEGLLVDIPFTSIVLFKTPPLLDSVWALVVAYTTFSLPFVIWILAGFFQSIPESIEEASYVDGSSRMGFLFRVLLPLSLPGIAASAIFTFLQAWDEFMFANAFTQTYHSKTLPIAMSEFVGKHGMDWGLITAGGVVSSLPPLLVSLFFYKYIVSGLTAGAVKG